MKTTLILSSIQGENLEELKMQVPIKLIPYDFQNFMILIEFENIDQVIQVD